MSKELKTLKDLFDNGEKGREFKPASYACGCPACNEGYFGSCVVVKLKAEAVKKIKALEGDYYNLIKIFPFKILNNREVRLLIDFIKWDNNLTEEDLK